ncbi:hypothetical protein CL648_04550 [bacterium]|nr:hypothetical protein [bacterium]
MIQTVRVAVIGLGNMGRHHAKHWHQYSGAELVSVCDSNRDRTHTYANQYGCQAYTNYETMLATETLDAVSIAVSTAAHASVALACIAAGVSVLIEKPIAKTVADAEQIHAAGGGVTVMIGHVERFNPAIVAVKRLLDTGALGTIISINTQRLSPLPSQITDSDVLLDLGVHDVDLVSYLMGASPIGSTVHTNDSHRPGYACHANIALEYHQNQSALIQVSWAHPFRQRTATITGTQGYAMVDLSGPSVTQYSDQNPEGISVEIVPGDALGAQIAHFSHCVQTQQTPMVTPESAIQTLTVLI